MELFPRTKSCRDCGDEKELDQFPLQKGGRFGRHPLCKACRSAQERRRYERDRDAILERQRNSASRKEAARWSQMKKRTGVTRQQYLDAHHAQNGCCAICGESSSVLRADHDHRTGAFRGLLCDRCNLALGCFLDDPPRLRSAATYLRRLR